MKSLGVVIARFQAHQITPAHEALLKAAASGNSRLLVLLGVHPVQRKRDPLDFGERFTMLMEWWSKHKPQPTKDQTLDFFVVPAFNFPSDEDWAKNIDRQIAALSLGGKVTLYCGPDGAGPAYAKAGGRHPVEVVSAYEKHATSVRQALTPRHTEDYRVGVIVASERRFVNPFMCVDAFVTDGELVLLGRKHTDPPGRWRMPGGFVDPQESLEAAVYREVREETGIQPQHSTYVRSQLIHDWRYAEGPENILSACFVVITRKGERARPADDIEEVQWFSITGFQMEVVHPNHQDLVRAALGMLERTLHEAKALEGAER